MAKRKIGLFFIIILSSFCSFSQVSWNIVSDSVSLNPKVFKFKADLYFSPSSGPNQIITPEPEVEFNISDKTISFVYKGNAFKLKADQFSSVRFIDYKFLSRDELTNKSIADSILFFYRKKIYAYLDLNEVEFSSSKRVSIAFTEKDELILKNQKISKGKICAIAPEFIVILQQDGELSVFADGDFNYFSVSDKRMFSCRALYDFVYNQFAINLKLNIKSWESKMLEMNIDSILSIAGPVDEVLEIGSNRKLFRWKSERTSYEFFTSGTTSSRISNFVSRQTQILSNLHFNAFSFSPFLIAGNSYRTANITSSSNAESFSTSSSSQYGKIIETVEGFNLSLLQGEGNRFIKIFHENIFSEPKYGSPFRFINFVL